MSRRFLLREKIFAIGDDSWVTDEQGQQVYLIDNKLLAIRKTYFMYDSAHREILKIQRQPLHLHKTITIEHNGQVIAQVQKAWLTVFRDKWNIQVPGGTDLVAQGDFLEHEYHITRDNQTIADISKRWFSIRESYGIEVFDETQIPVMIALTVAIDDMMDEANEHPPAEHHDQ